MLVLGALPQTVGILCRYESCADLFLEDTLVIDTGNCKLSLFHFT
jgi:hypothetical protein